MIKIKFAKAKEVLNSRGEPTVSAQLTTEDGIFTASVPAGASKGKYEAKTQEVKQAIKSIKEFIGPALREKEISGQKELDQILIELDGTKNKSRLGANAILAVSIAGCRAAAFSQKLPLYKYIAQIYYSTTPTKTRKSIEIVSQQALPRPCFNFIEGGIHAKQGLTLQEFMIVPDFDSFEANLKAGKKIFFALKLILKRKFGKVGLKIGDEGGFAPPIKKTKEALALLQQAIKKAGYKNKVGLALDSAASQFFKKNRDAAHYILEKKSLTRGELLHFYQELLEKYPIVFLEDPFSQDDWPAWQLFNAKLKSQNSKLLIVGDDLTVTNPTRISLAYQKHACNAVIIKPNQIGTVSETLEAVKLAKGYGWKIIVSHRSGETMDDFISHLAVGVGADFIKAGAPQRAERMAKYNCLLKIECQQKAGNK